MVISLVLTSFSLAGEVKNLIPNPSFEEVDLDDPNLPRYWKFSPGAIGAGEGELRVTEKPIFEYEKEGIDGSRSISIKGRGTSYGSWDVDLNPDEIEPNTDYELSFYIKCEDLSGDLATFGIFNTSYYIKDIYGTRKWTLWRTVINSGENPMPRLNLVIYFRPGKVWFDRISLTEIKKEAEINKEDVLLEKVFSLNPHKLELEKDILLDGRLDETCWQKALKVGDFRILGGEKAPNQTTVFIFYDNDAIYLGFRCEEPKIKELENLLIDRDTSVWSEDSIEIFIDHNVKREKYYHFALNMKATQYDAKADVNNPWDPYDISWNANWFSRAYSGDNFWSAEIKIPFTSLQITSDVKDKWLINLCRGRPLTKEYSSVFVCSKLKGFCDPSVFGEITFSNIDFSRFCWDVSKEIKGSNLEITVKNLSSNITSQILDVLVNVGSTLRWKKEEKLSIQKGETKKVSFLLPSFGHEEKIDIYVELKDAKDGSNLVLLPCFQFQFSPLMKVEIISPFYRNNIYATEKINKIIFNVELNESFSDKLSSLSLETFLKDKDGKIIKDRLISSITKEKFQVEIPIPELQIGTYNLILDLKENKNTIFIVEEKIKKLPTNPSEVRFDEYGRCLVNGKLYFPIGWYGINTNSDLDEVVAEGYNTVLYWLPIDPEQCKKVNEIHSKNNIMIVSSVDHLALQKRDFEKAGLAVTPTAITQSSVLGWIIADEPSGINAIPPSTLKEFYEILRERDPFHFITLYDNHPPTYAVHKSAVDVLFIDIYPCVCGLPIGTVADYTDRAVKAMGKKPVWVVLEGFNESVLRNPGEKFKPPAHVSTYEETRAMTYLSFIHGAKAVLWWGRSLTDSKLIKDREIISKELKELAPVFLSVEIIDGINSEPSIDLMAKKYKGKIYLFAVNRDQDTKLVQYSLPFKIKEVNVLFENRKIRPGIENEVFIDDFGEFGTHIYEIDIEL